MMRSFGATMDQNTTMKGKAARSLQPSDELQTTSQSRKVRLRGQIPGKILGPRLLLIATTAALVIFGLVMVYSSSYVEAFTNPNIDDSSHIFRRQAVLVGVGIVVMLIAAVIDYRVWNSPLSWVIWVLVIILLVATLLVGVEINGGKRWLEIAGQQFQPSEFAKIALILLVATRIIKLRESTNVTFDFILLGLIIGTPVILIMIQPDLGTTLIVLAGVVAVAWFGELSMKPLAIVGFLIFFFAAAAVMLTDFRAERIDAWLDPFAYASTSGYQIINSLYAFAGGGVTGVGLGMSHQKYLYLPEPYNDLIFPIIGEEFGLIGTVIVVALFLAFMYASFKIARNAPDFFGRMVAGSAACLIGFQAFLNMLCMVNLIPMTGKPLPFFSAGGTSIIVTLISVGLILNVSFRSKVVDGAKERREDLLILDGGRGFTSPGVSVSSFGMITGLAKLAPASGRLSGSGAVAGKTISTKPLLEKRAGGKPTKKNDRSMPEGRVKSDSLRTKSGNRSAGASSGRPSGRPLRPATNPALRMSPARNRGKVAALSDQRKRSL